MIAKENIFFKNKKFKSFLIDMKFRTLYKTRIYNCDNFKKTSFDIKNQIKQLQCIFQKLITLEQGFQYFFQKVPF